MTALRVAALDGLLLATGLGMLTGTGLVRSLRDAARLAGLAFLVGLAGLGTLLSAVLAGGAALTLPLVLALAAALGGAGGVARLRTTSPPPRGAAPATRWERQAAAVAFLAGVVYLGWVLRTVHAAGASSAWDAWGFWIPKAKSIFFFGGLDTGVGGFTSFANPDYPPLLPVFDATVFRFAGTPDATLLPVQEWLLTLAFLWGAAGTLRHRVRLGVLAGSLLLVLLTPDLGAAIGTSLADLPLSLLLATGALCLALWLLEDEQRYLVPAAVVLAGAALTKKEGLALVLLLVLVTAVARRSLRRFVPLGTVALVPVIVVLPWRFWLRSHHVVTSGDYRLGDLIDPGYLSGRWGRLATSADRVPQYLFDVGRWELVLPLALLAALLVRRRVSILALGFTALALVGLVVVYWISFLPIEFHLETSATRTVMPVVLVGAALLPLLLAEALYPRAASSER